MPSFDKAPTFEGDTILTPAGQEAIKRWAEWAPATPVTEWLPSPYRRPDYARATITERIEPWATKYEAILSLLPGNHYADEEDDREPDPDFYRPTQRLRRLQRKRTRYHAKGFHEVPNPDYDAERAAEWEKRMRWSQTTYTIGQSYTPQFTEDE